MASFYPTIAEGPRMIYFMYHHHQHCSITFSDPLSSDSTSTFPQFPKLPIELRLKIWETVASEPQTIELSCTPTSPYMPQGRWFSHNKPHILFSISSESRYVAARSYTRLEFSLGQIGVGWPILYINFERDRLWLCNDLSATLAKDVLEKNKQLKEQLRFLIVGESLWRILNQTKIHVPGLTCVRNQATVVPGFAEILEDNEVEEMQLTAVARYLEVLEQVKFHS